MLMVTQPVQDLMRHMFHPIGEQIINKFLHEMDLLSVFENRIHYKSDKAHSSLSSDENNVVTLDDNRVTVELVPNMNPFSTKWETATFFSGMHSNNPLSDRVFDRKVLFHDATISTTLMEREVPANLILNVSMKFVDEVIAYATANKILTTYTDGEKFFVEDLYYNYPLPEKTYIYLYGFHKMKSGTPSTFVQYLRDMSGERISVNVNRFDMENGQRQLVVRKNLAETIAQIDFTGEKPEVQTADQSADAHYVNFTVTIQFSRAHMVDLIYPIHMMNQQVPAELLVVDLNKQRLYPERSHPYFVTDAFRLWWDSTQVTPVAPMVKLPWYDNWDVPSGSALGKLQYKAFLSIAFTLDNIDDLDGETIIDLENLGEVTLVPEIIAAIKAQGTGTLYFSQPIAVAVYTNDCAIEPSELILDDAVLHITKKNPYPVYRLVIAEYIGKPYGTLNTFRVANSTIIATLER